MASIKQFICQLLPPLMDGGQVVCGMKMLLDGGAVSLDLSAGTGLHSWRSQHKGTVVHLQLTAKRRSSEHDWLGKLAH